MRQELFWFCEDEVRLYLWNTCHQPSRVKVKVAQLYPTLCDPMDCTVRGILQTRILEWVAIPFSRGSSQPRDRTQVSHVAGGFFTVWATREAILAEGQCQLAGYCGHSQARERVSSLRVPAFSGVFLLSHLLCESVIHICVSTLF